MDINHAVAVNVKRIREQKKLTLDGAAALTGVSRSMLAQIEKGDVNPTISVLWKIAKGYRVSFTSLVEDKSRSVSLIRLQDSPCLKEDEGRYQNYPTFPFDENRLFECYRIVIEVGGSLNAQPHLKGAEEYITVFSGQVEITVDKTVFSLAAGDSIRFLADVPHGYRNVGQGEAALSMMIYYNEA